MSIIRLFATALILAAVLSVSVSLSLNGGQGKQRQQPARADSVRERDTHRSNGVSEDEGEEILGREKYFRERRAGGPGQTIPPDAYARAIRQKVALRSKANPHSIASVLPDWQSVNQFGMEYTAQINVSGRANQIAFHPTDPNTMYLATAGGGVWKTTDGGVNWFPLTDHLTSMSSGAVAVDPQNPETIFWASGEQNYSLDSYYGDGVFRSLDGGASWAKIATISVGSYFSQIVINPLNTSIVYLAGSNGIYRSTNGGTIWKNLNVGTYADCLIMNPQNPMTLYTTISDVYNNELIRKTTDGGATWTTMSFGGATAGRCQLAIAPGDTNVLYASTPLTGSQGSVYRSLDAGLSWVLRNHSVNYTGSQGWYDNAVVVDPNDPDHVIVGGINAYSSTNGGLTLAQITATSNSNFTHADIHYLVYNGLTLYCCSDGGIYRSTDNGNTWADLNRTLSTLQYQGADYEPANPDAISGGMQDNGRSKTTNGGVSTTQPMGGDGGYLLIDQVNSQYYYGQYYNGTGSECLDRSSNHGLSYQSIQPRGSGGLFYPPFEIAPGNMNCIVFGLGDVWRTSGARTATAGSGWTRIMTARSSAVSAIGISSTNTDKIYIGFNDGGTYVTTDGGTHWTSTSFYKYVSDIAVDPMDDNTAYATLTGFGNYHVAKTTNGGATWNSITGNLPNIPVNSIVLRQAAPRMLIIGSDIGVFYSVNDGNSWEALDNGLPIAAVFDLKYKEEPRKLLAATHGRGCWMLDMSGFAFGVSPYALAFGDIHVGSSQTSAVTVSNGSAATLTIASVTSDHPAFTVSPQNASIPAGGSQIFQITFTPQAPAGASANITFFNDGVTSPDVVPMNGTGVTAVFSTARLLRFGNIPAGSSKQMNITVTNTGNIPLNIAGIASSEPAFQIASVVDAIPAGESRTYPCTFQPPTPGSFAGSIIFTDDAQAVYDTIAVTGGGAVASITVDVLTDADGSLLTTGDETPKPWHVLLYRDSISAGTLVDEADGPACTFNIVASGSYIVSEADSTGLWLRINGNRTRFDTLQVEAGQSPATTFVNKIFFVSFSVAAKWNLVSIPVGLWNNALPATFPRALTGFFGYDTGRGYSQGYLANQGRGYWLRFAHPENDTMYGALIVAETLRVGTGWNLIGMISTPLPAAEVVSVPSDNLASMFWEYTTSYHAADSLMPGKGYWIKVNHTGDLFLTKQPIYLAAPKTGISVLRDLNSLTITDATGAEQTLYFGPAPSGATVGEHYFDMPPAPPEGMFDIRFASQKVAEVFDPASGDAAPMRIILSSAVYPLTVTWNLVRSAASYSLTDGMNGTLFVASMERSGGTAIIKNPNVKSLILRSGSAGIPLEYGLDQNYPNPFNPGTMIRYRLPEESRVMLKIYNVIGQEVRTLANGVQPAGYQSIAWDALDNRQRSVPSGFYFYRLEAAGTQSAGKSFNKVLKMMIVR